MCLRTRLINGFGVMRWSHHKVIERNSEDQIAREEKKDHLPAVFCQGRNYTFTVFFSKDGPHRSQRGIYEPISNMKYRHQESILPLFFTFSPFKQITTEFSSGRAPSKPLYYLQSGQKKRIHSRPQNTRLSLNQNIHTHIILLFTKGKQYQITKVDEYTYTSNVIILEK